MLLDSDRVKLETLIKEKLGVDAAEGFFVATLDDGMGRKREGVVALSPTKVVFVAQDVLDGQIWKEWPRKEISDFGLKEEIFGARLTFTAGKSLVNLERISKEAASKIRELIQPDFSEYAGVNAEEVSSVRTSAQTADGTKTDSDAGAVGSGNWICPSCRRNNESHYKYCLGCGDEFSAPAQHAQGPTITTQTTVPCLVGVGKHLGKFHVLDRAINKVGRSQNAQIVIDSGDVSRTHALIEVEGDTSTLIDLDSAGGTYVNGVKINRHELKKGDHIRFGNDNEFVFEQGATVQTTSHSFSRFETSVHHQNHFNRSNVSSHGPGTSHANRIILLIVLSLSILGLGMAMVFLMS